MDVIKAIANQRVQELKKIIGDKQYRYDNSIFLIEGYNIVKDCPKGRVNSYYLSESSVDKYTDIIADSPYYVLDDRLYERVLDTKSPQGICAICNMSEPYIENGSFSVIADNISDPANLATIIRSVAACGVKNLILYGNCCDIYSPKVARACMGGIFHINIIIVKSLEKMQFSNIYILDMVGTNIYHREDKSITVNDNAALAVGSEARGISEELYRYNNTVLSIPMSGQMESLNAGVSLSIALFEIIYGGK